MNTARRKLIPITAVGILNVIGYDEFFDCSEEDVTDEKVDEEDAAYQEDNSRRIDRDKSGRAVLRKKSIRFIKRRASMAQ